MKYSKIILSAIAIATGSVFAAAQIPATDNCDIVIAGTVDPSSIPHKAKSYIKKYFHKESVVEVEKEFLTGEVEVKLSSGTELTFNSKGEINEIDAADNAVLSERVIHSLLPHSAYKVLEKKNYAKYVDNVKKTGNGYIVDVDDAFDTEVEFTKYGELKSISRD